jgi:hypothetical protein
VLVEIDLDLDQLAPAQDASIAQRSAQALGLGT